MEKEHEAHHGVELSPTRKAASVHSDLLSERCFVELPADVAGSFAAFQQEVEVHPSEGYTEHRLALREIAQLYQASIDLGNLHASQGLSSSEAKRRLQKNGPNVLTPPARTPNWLKFARQFKNLFMVLLLAAAALSLILFAIEPLMINLWLGVILILVVFLNCLVSFLQEAKTEQIMATFAVMLPQFTTVLRDGRQRQILAQELVVGDIVILSGGEKVPADVRILTSAGLKVDQSLLTGESEPIECTVDATDEDPLESKNLTFNGASCVEGEAHALVIRTGDHTLIGHIAALTGGQKPGSSTLEREVQRFVKIISILAIAMAVLIFVIGVARGRNVFDTFVSGFLVMIVANVPQGLPPTVTSCLAVVAKRLGRLNVFVKRLDCVETLGSVSVICSDKTGTLTENRMTVCNVWLDGAVTSAEEFRSSYHREGAVAPSMQLLTHAAVLNSRVAMLGSRASTGGDSDDRLSGDATELGIYKFCQQLVDIEDYRRQHPKVLEIPFNSAHKWQLSVHTDVSGAQMVLLKGAPERVLQKCTSRVSSHGDAVALDEEFSASFEEGLRALAKQGQRVLAFAFKRLPEPIRLDQANNTAYRDSIKDDLLSDLVFIGAVALADPPRAEVPAAVEECRTAGIKVVMVTGDFPITAAAIARQVGIVTHPTREDIAEERGIPIEDVPEDDIHAVVVHGGELVDFDDAKWELVLNKREIVFARTSPQQKLEIVERFQSMGAIIAMTGDGVNDSPALRRADIGVGMGKNGSDVAREAADIILLDDNFASIVTGIKEGRTLFDNLKKTIAYTLTHLWPEILPVCLNFLLGMPLGLSPLLVLCIDLYSELPPAISVAFEPAELDIMLRDPRDPVTGRLMTFPLLAYAYLQAGFIEAGGCLLAYLVVFQSYGISAAQLVGLGDRHFLGASSEELHLNGKVFTVEDQETILATVQSTWYLTVVLSQAMHIFLCKTRTQSILKHGCFRNMGTVLALLVTFCLCALLLYTPGIQEVFGTTGVHPKYFWPAAISMVALFVWTEGSKYYFRRFPNSGLAAKFSW